MTYRFPEAIRSLPEADVGLDGVTAYLSQSDTHQILFMECETDVAFPEHSHQGQVGFVLEGRIDLSVNGEMLRMSKGDRYSIPPGVAHSGKAYAGFVCITFFNEPGRYGKK